jgi:hypothetical protein
LLAASPAGPARTSMSAPSGASSPAYRSAASPLASIGTRRPRPGTGAIIATSAKGTPRASAMLASSRLVPGDAVFRSAQTAPGPTPGSPARKASTAALLLFTLSTRSAPRAASASLPASTRPGPAETAGS